MSKSSTSANYRCARVPYDNWARDPADTKTRIDHKYSFFDEYRRIIVFHRDNYSSSEDSESSDDDDDGGVGPGETMYGPETTYGPRKAMYFDEDGNAGDAWAHACAAAAAASASWETDDEGSSGDEESDGEEAHELGEDSADTATATTADKKFLPTAKRSAYVCKDCLNHPVYHAMRTGHRNKRFATCPQHPKHTEWSAKEAAKRARETAKKAGLVSKNETYQTTTFHCCKTCSRDYEAAMDRVATHYPSFEAAEAANGTDLCQYQSGLGHKYRMKNCYSYWLSARRLKGEPWVWIPCSELQDPEQPKTPKKAISTSEDGAEDKAIESPQISPASHRQAGQKRPREALSEDEYQNSDGSDDELSPFKKPKSSTTFAAENPSTPSEDEEDQWSEEE